MRGSTRKRGSTWTALWSTTGDDGKRRQRSRGGFGTRREAQQFLASVTTSLAEGTYAEPSKTPLARYLTDEWLPSISRTVRPGTVSTYSSMIRTHVVARDVGAIPLRALSPGHLNALYRELDEAGRSPATIRLVHSVLSRALRDAVRWRKLARSPAADADPPRAASSRATAWTERELRTFLDHVRDDRLCALWRLASTTGMRRGELLGLDWRSVNLDGARLRVERQLLTDGTFGPPKSKRSERTVALDDETFSSLHEHRDVQLAERAFAADAYEDGDLVFADEIGQPIPLGRLSETFMRRRRAAGIPTGSLHVLRHTAATLALTNGVPVHVVAARIGDRPETLLSVYSHLLPTSDAEAAERVAAVLA